MATMFSIVVPIYNLESCLEETLKSIHAQTNRDFECICVDDGSTDASGSILDRYAQLDPCIRAVHQPNEGVCGARNLGIERASGEWIIFLDGDDVLHPQALEKLAELITLHPGIDFIKFDSEDFKTTSWESTPLTGCESVSEVDFSSLVPNGTYYWVIWKMCYRRSVVASLRYDPRIKRNMGEDRVYLIQSYDLVGRGLVYDGKIHGYRVREGSAIHSEKTLEKWYYDLIHYERVCKVIDSSSKDWSRGIVHTLSAEITEGFVDGFEAANADDRVVLYGYWRSFLLAISNCRIFNPWYRFVITVCAHSCGRFLPLLFCKLPRQIKKIGIHR